MKKALFSIFILLSFTSIVKANTINELYNELNSLKEAKEYAIKYLDTGNYDDYKEYQTKLQISMDNYIEVFLTFREFYSTFFQHIYKHIALKPA